MGNIQRLQIRGSTKNRATGSKGDRKKGEKETDNAGSRRRAGEETKNECLKKKSEEGFNGEKQGSERRNEGGREKNC